MASLFLLNWGILVFVHWSMLFTNLSVFGIQWTCEDCSKAACKSFFFSFQCMKTSEPQVRQMCKEFGWTNRCVVLKELWCFFCWPDSVAVKLTPSRSLNWGYTDRCWCLILGHRTTISSTWGICVWGSMETAGEMYSVTNTWKWLQSIMDSSTWILLPFT